MLLCLYSDNHWSQYSSIVRRRGEKYSVRLENQINSINWVMRLAEDYGCLATVCMGDFFDKSELNSEEISALKEIKWAGMSNYFIAGNHEMGIADHSYSSAKLFSLLDTGDVITEPTKLAFSGNTEICILPYILETDRKALVDYFPTKATNKKRIILSHNDIAGVQMGKFISEDGFSIEEIESNCDLFINGHLHNGEKISDKIINIGNLTGQNFNEDAIKYDHCAFILDTETLKIEVYENPYAFNFYKLDAVNLTPNLQALKNNAIVTLKCYSKDVEVFKNNISKLPNIIESRITIQPEIQVVSEDIREELTVDHLETFKKYMLDNVENSKELLEELAEVLK